MAPHHLKAFTIMELIVVVIVIGALASLAIPQWTLAVKNDNRENLKLQLITIHSAQMIRKAKTGFYWPPFDGSNRYISEINFELDLKIRQLSGSVLSCRADLCDGNINHTLEFMCEAMGFGCVCRSIQNRLCKPLDGCKRCFQLVRYVGNKFPLGGLAGSHPFHH